MTISPDEAALYQLEIAALTEDQNNEEAQKSVSLADASNVQGRLAGSPGSDSIALSTHLSSLS
jgi:hypothetical protein